VADVGKEHGFRAVDLRESFCALAFFFESAGVGDGGCDLR
jgi:hypothetical protein